MVIESATRSIDGFLGVKTNQTRKAYKQALEYLARFLKVNEASSAYMRALTKIDATTAAEFYRWFREQPSMYGGRLADATITQRMHLIRKVYRYLVAVGAAKVNPFDALHNELPKRARRQKRPTKLIPFDAIGRILALPDRRTKVGKRDFCILSLLFGGGLRRSEVQKLNLGDVVISAQGTLCLLLRETKNGATQQQPLPEWAAEAFTQLVSQRAGEGAGNDDPLLVFYSRQGVPRGRLAVETVRRIYQRHTEAVGLGRVSPHSARATAATWLKASGYEDRDVAAFLRHTTTNMVEVYDKRSRTPDSNAGLSLAFGCSTKRKTAGDK